MSITVNGSNSKRSTSDNEDVEESIFAVELHGLFDEIAVQKSVDENKCRVHRIDSQEPLIQVGSQIFVGRWEETVGTDMIFKEIPHRHLLNFMGVSNKRLTAQRVILLPKTEKDKNEETTNNIVPESTTVNETEGMDVDVSSNHPPNP